MADWPAMDVRNKAKAGKAVRLSEAEFAVQIDSTA